MNPNVQSNIQSDVQTPEIQKPNKFKQLWSNFKAQHLFAKITIVVLALTLLLTPFIIVQQTNFFSHAGISLLTNCTPIPTGLTQQQIQQLSKNGTVRWCTTTSATSTTTDTAPDFAPGSPQYATAPQKLDTGNYLFGAYFYPSWYWPQPDILNWYLFLKYYTSPNSDQLDALNRTILLNPVSGNQAFPEEKPWVADYDIKWALEHGIGYFAFDWYWDTASTSPTLGGVGKETSLTYSAANSLSPAGYSALNDGLHSFLNSQYNKNMYFTLMLSSNINWGVDEAPQLVDAWANYFNKSNYLFINNKPVVIIGVNLPYKYGNATTKAILDAARSAAQQKYGLQGIYFLANASFLDYTQAQQAGFDGITSYGYGRAGTPSLSLVAPYDNLVSGYTSKDSGYIPSSDTFWQLQGQTLPFIPSVTTGFDERARYWINSDQQTIRTFPTVESFTYSLMRAKDYVDGNPNTVFSVRNLTDPTVSSNKKMLLAYAWNEITEGGYLMPTRGKGFSFLNAIRSVFGVNPQQIKETWMQDGNILSQLLNPITQTVLKTATNVPEGTVIADGNQSWTNYRVTASINPTFVTNTTADQHVGFEVLKNGQNYLYIFIRQRGIYAIAHTVNGYGSEYQLTQFASPLPASGVTYSLNIDIWKGRVNVEWNNTFIPSLYLPTHSSQFSTVSSYGGIEPIATRATLATLSLKVTTLPVSNTGSILFGPVNGLTNAVTAGNTSWKNYRTTYTFTPTWSSASNQHTGVQIRVNGSNYIWVFARPSGMRWAQNTSTGTFGEKVLTSTPITSGQTYNLQVDAYNNMVYVYLNSVFIGSIDLSKLSTNYAAGGIKVYSYGATSVSFQGVTVTAL